VTLISYTKYIYMSTFTQYITYFCYIFHQVLPRPLPQGNKSQIADCNFGVRYTMLQGPILNCRSGDCKGQIVTNTWIKMNSSRELWEQPGSVIRPMFPAPTPAPTLFMDPCMSRFCVQWERGCHPLLPVFYMLRWFMLQRTHAIPGRGTIKVC
jgi:hypothetical protein